MTRKPIYEHNGTLDTLLPPTRVTPELSNSVIRARQELSRKAGQPVSQATVIRLAIEYAVAENLTETPELSERYIKAPYGRLEAHFNPVWVLSRQKDFLNSTAVLLNVSRAEVIRRVVQLYLDREVVQKQR